MSVNHTPPPLDYRIAVDLDLIQQASEALMAMRTGMLENKGPLTPSRRDALFDTIWLLKPDGPE